MQLDDIKAIHKALGRVLSNWHEHPGFSPPKYRRIDGMGKEVALVDPWCGGYQKLGSPVMIGWTVAGPGYLRKDNHHESDVVLVADAGGDKQLAINLACQAADNALVKLGWPIHGASPHFELVEIDTEATEADVLAVGGAR